jgi:hypothetical protein
VTRIGELGTTLAATSNQRTASVASCTFHKFAEGGTLGVAIILNVCKCVYLR